jgi:alkyl hydroperoxide reductase subunit D
MNLDAFLDAIPAYARDLKLNLSTLLRQPELTEQQTWGTVLASAIASRNPKTIGVLVSEAETHLTPEALGAAKAAAAIMGMNNVFYRFQHLANNERYTTIPARLRMNAIRTHGGDPVDFELWCAAVSAINACGTCVASHEKALREKGVTEETIVAAIRIASVIHALSAVFDAETALTQSLAASQAE